MRVIPPLSIADAMLTTSTVTEPSVGEATYAAGTTYAAGARVILGSPASTVTISIASPGVVTWSAHGLPDGTPVVLTTTGALSTGLTAGAIYYVLNGASGTFQLTAEVGGAPIVTTGSQSGTHTATAQLHRQYESQAGSNTGNPPAIDDGTHWVDIGPTNRWSAFDLDRNTGCIGASPMVIELTPGERVDSIGLGGMVADAMLVEVIVSGVTIYSFTRSLRIRPTTGWYSYFTGPFAYQANVGLFDLPPINTAMIRVTLTRATGNVTLGSLAIGRGILLGNVQFDPSSDVLNFSKVDRDDFGSSILVRRRTAPITSQSLWTPKGRVNALRAVREQLNATVAFWSGLDDSIDGYFEALVIFGYYRKFSINLTHPDVAVTSLELEEV